METIKKVQHNIFEAFDNIVERFPGLLALLSTLVIVSGFIR